MLMDHLLLLWMLISVDRAQPAVILRDIPRRALWPRMSMRMLGAMTTVKLQIPPSKLSLLTFLPWLFLLCLRHTFCIFISLALARQLQAEEDRKASEYLARRESDRADRQAARNADRRANHNENAGGKKQKSKKDCVIM